MNTRSIFLFFIFCLNVVYIRANNEKQETKDCASLTNESLFVFLTLTDLLHYHSRLYVLETQQGRTGLVVNITAPQCSHCDSEENKKLQQEIEKNNYYKDCFFKDKQYRARINVDTDIGHVEFSSILHEEPNNLKMQPLWNKFMENKTTLHVDYQIHLVSFKAIFDADGTKCDMFNELDEIVNVLEHIRRIIDIKLAQECVDHQGSFVKKYESLKSELGDEFMEYLSNLDSIKGFDKPWDNFTNVVTQMEEIVKGAHPPPDAINKTNETFQFPISIMAAKYEHKNTSCFLEKNENEEIRDPKQRTITFKAHVGNDGGVVDVKLT